VLVNADPELERFDYRHVRDPPSHGGHADAEEIEAIDLITEHVAGAIMWSRDEDDFARDDSPRSKAPPLRLVCDNQQAHEPSGRLLALAERLHAKAADFDQFATRSESEIDAEHLRNAAELSRKLGTTIKAQIDRVRSRKPVS